MATVEHCLYCFETLAANLENRKPMTLDELRTSYAEFRKSGEPSEDGADAKRLPALKRLAADSNSSPSSSSSSGSSSPSLSSAPTSTAAGTARGTPATSTSSLPSSGAFVTESPLFVTWNILSPRHGHVLRGCIGTFEAEELSDGLSSYALISALQDNRFSPISADELPRLQVTVTLLTDFEDAADADDWELGTHGLRISFHHHGKRYGATYLPDVAPEQGWSKEETVVSLMRKAGWMGSKSKWRDVDLKVVRYQGKARSVEYAEFKEWRDWADKHPSAS